MASRTIAGSHTRFVSLNRVPFFNTFLQSPTVRKKVNYAVKKRKPNEKNFQRNFRQQSMTSQNRCKRTTRQTNSWRLKTMSELHCVYLQELYNLTQQPCSKWFHFNVFFYDFRINCVRFSYFIQTCCQIERTCWAIWSPWRG